MARLKFDGKEYELPDSEDWTTGELSEAEHALGTSFGGESQGDVMAISFYIAVRREDKEIPPVLLADRVKQVKMGELLLSEPEEEEGPLAEQNGHAEHLSGLGQQLML